MGVPVYLYEFQHRPEAYEYTRPSFVRADHADELMFIFGACFWNGHIKVTGVFWNEIEQTFKKRASPKTQTQTHRVQTHANAHVEEYVLFSALLQHN